MIIENAYKTTAVEQSQVIHWFIPKESKKTLTSIKEDIIRVYPIGTSRFLSFDNAIWSVTSDGIATVQIELPRTKGPRETVTLNGTWEPRNSVTQINMTGTGLYGLKLTIDGLLHPSNDGWRLDGVFTVKVRDARHVEQVVLHLTQVSNPTPNEWAVASIEGFRQSRALEQSLRSEDRPLSEPTELIGGVPIPTNYDAKFKVKVDGDELAPMSGQLSLNRVEDLAEPTIGLTIATEGPVVYGWSGWITNPESGKNPQSGVAVTASNGRILLKLSAATSFQRSWWTRKPGSRDELVPVIADEGTIDIQVNGNNFYGTINAKGRIQEGKHPVSAFSATLSGKRQGSDFVNKVANFIGARTFDGRWRDAKLGKLKLRQLENKVRGEFSGGRVIEGTVSGQILDFSWKSFAAKYGKGFLSSAGNGLLVGMVWEGEQKLSFEPIVAIQSLPAKPAVQPAYVPIPKNDAQAQELKYLGYDLYSAGKYQEATDILNTVVTYFADLANKSKNDPAAYSNYSVSQVLPLLTLIDSASDAGDYPTLVKALSMAVSVQREMGKNAVGLRSFREQVGKYIVELEKGAETMHKLADAFDRGLKILSSAGIGISFEEGKNTSGIKISGVRPDMPAGQAGIVPGDVLLAIGGVSVTGMSVEQASIRLRGEVDSSVTITLSKSGHSLDIKLLRASLTNLGSGRREELTKAITGLRVLAAGTSEDYQADAADLKSPAKAMSSQATERPDVQAAFFDLTGRIEKLQTRLVKNRPEMIALARQSLAGSPKALGLFDRFVALQDEQMTNRQLDNEGMERMQKLDQDEEEFEKSLEASDLDKEMLRLSMIMLSELNSMSVKASGRIRVVKKAVESSSQASSTDQTAKHLAGLAVRLDNWRSKMVSDEAKIASLEYGQDFYANYVRTLADLNLPEQALVASEAARARAFQDLLAGRTDFSITSETNSSKTSFPNPKAVPPITLDEILDIVKERNSTVIEYMPIEKELFIWIASPEGKINMLRQPMKGDDITGTVSEFVKLVEPKPLKEQKETEHRLHQVLTDIHALLIEPIPQDLLPSNPDKAITIVPYGQLFRVPFNILKDRNGNYFINKHALVFSAAISVLRYTHDNKVKSTHRDNTNLLAVVNPKPLPNSSYPQLDVTEHEFRRLLNFYPKTGKEDILLGIDATKANLRTRLKAGEHAVVYFGTHGDIDDNDALKSYIALARLKGKGQAEDGKLTISDIFGLDLRSDLSILSACKTGRGAVSADGVNGLSRAFVWGGSASLMTSLWSIPEEISFQQVYEFHQHWRSEGMSKANALRMVQMNAMESYPDQPGLWAGFQLYGEWE